MLRTLVRRAPKTNLTGFNTKDFLAAAGTRGVDKADPWHRNEEWRYTGPYSRWTRFKGAFPGFGIAAVAFAGYCTYEAMFLNDDHHGHGDGHGEGHH